MEYCDGEKGIPNICNEIVNYRYAACGHIKENVKCAEAFSWAADDNEKQPVCKKPARFINPVCRHENRAPCNEIDLIRKEWQLEPWLSDADRPKLVELCLGYKAETNEPIYGYSVNEEALKVSNLKPAPHGISKNALNCEVHFELNRKCGHSFYTKCSDVYWKTYPQCEEPIVIECEIEDCKHRREVACHVYASEERAGKKKPCQNKVTRLCKKCNFIYNKIEFF